MGTRQSRRHTDRFQVRSAAGQTFTIDEFTTFLVIEEMSGHTEEHVVLRELRSGPHSVTANDDGAFDVVTSQTTSVRCWRA